MRRTEHLEIVKVDLGQNPQAPGTEDRLSEVSRLLDQERAARLRAEQILEDAGIAILEFGGDDWVRFATREAITALDQPVESLIGRTWDEIAPLLLDPDVLGRIKRPTPPAKSNWAGQVLGEANAWVKVRPNLFCGGLTVYFRNFAREVRRDGK